MKKIAVLVVAAGALYVGTASHGVPAASTASASGAAATAISYAQQQIGKPYLWGGTGPDTFDCSGLTYRAYGSSIARTSQAQWATEMHVSQAAPGDLVFFAGADGTATSPGHVGLVTDPGRNLMIDAYASGTTVRYETYGLPGSAPGLANPVGFTDPTASGRGA
jgi:peptidoglycan DL-endopeptidase CwlO